MSGNWDDSDTDSEPVEIVEKPVIIPRARQPSIAKSLEKVAILENSVAGSVKDADDSDDDSLSVGSANSEDFEDFEGTIVTLDFDATTHMKKMISQFTCSYRNIVAEFADVEIFLISLDSLIVECLAHKYHNWELAGQSVVLTTQIDRFLQQFVNLGGKFKLIVFTDLATHFARDTTAAFARATAIAHVASGPFAKDLVYFSSPVDTKWTTFLHDLTPSFLMISTDNLTREACAQEDVNITPQLETIVIHALAQAVPIVPLTSIVVNFASVNAYHIVPKLVIMHNWDSFVAAHWDCNSDLLRSAKNPTIDVSKVSSTTDLWVNIIKEAKKSKVSEHFDSLACAALLSSLVSIRRGTSRVYLPVKEGGKRGLDVIKDRRTLLTTATSYLEKVNFEGAKFVLSDLWDGRMVLSLFDYINANESVLPYRLQSEFAVAHAAAGLSKPLAVDTAEKLFDPIAEVEDPLSKLPILYSVESPLFDTYIPDMRNAKSDNFIKDGMKQDYVAYFQEKMSWKLKVIEEDFAKKEEKIEDAWQLKRANKARQFMSRWYEMFANSLEGRGSNLLVDFSRTPRFAKEEEESADTKKKGGKAWAGQKQGGGGGGAKKAGKEPVKSKKDLILEANKKNKDIKIIESEKTKIKFATQQGVNATIFLENLYSSLEVPETRALCIFEITTREAKELLTRLTGAENMAIRRIECVNLVGRLKDCFVKHWNYLEDKQREQVVDMWVSLGFEAPAGSKPSVDARQKKLDLGMNMVYYQLEYGGELVDIQSDPKKDERVTGFAPDAWQRRMLDSVDKGNSAIIVAPTSAGKTFVSYYCIEKVLRASDDDVVVYVSPSKALMNQVCGSVYARFKNKSMSRGRALFGTLTPEYGNNPLTCQVLVTVPECLETLLLSTNPTVQEFVSHIRYVVFDEVHSIGASEEAHIWEHLLLLIHCPFLALSATIGNASKLHAWLDSAESSKTSGKRRVDIIEYGERYSELELSIVSIDKPLAIEHLEDGEVDGKSVNTVAPRSGEVLKPFMPYGVFMPEKLRMFGIPDDQQLTARQILQLYNTMASADKQTKEEFEPCHYFGYKPTERVWLSRSKLRELENKLKERFLQWLQGDEEKMHVVLEKLGGGDVKEQLDHRALPFNKEKTAVDSIVPLIDEMRAKQMLPAICFNDDRHVCEALATRLGEELEDREKEFVNTAEFKNKYAIKDEEKLMKAAKRKRDLDEKKKKKGDKPDENPQDVEDDSDPLASMRAKLKQVLDRFKLRGRGGGDQDTYDKMVERMSRQAKNRESSRLLLRLFERGIGFHHAGLNMVEKGAVEVLFRSGHLAIIFSTSTLALGVNMPCKTVMFGVDTPMLTPLLYRQMSGRAGRRGFDHSGTVVFMSVPTSKMRRLLTASLSNLQGNPPFTTSFLLRMLSYVHQKDVPSTERAGPITTLKDRTTVALSLVRNSFSLFTRKEAEGGILQSQLKMFTAFSVQVLRHLQLLDQSCAGKNLYGLAASLQENEPGNLVFIHLLHKGAFHTLFKQYQGDRAKLKLKMLTVLANLFTRERLPLSFQPDDKSSYPHELSGRCHIFLPSLPSEMQGHLEQYNQVVMELYYKYMSAASADKQLIAPGFSVSGAADSSSLLLNDDLVSPIFDGYSHDTSFLPLINLDQRDHRGRKVHHNAFAVDFFIHESRQLLATVNRLSVSRMWFLLHDFVEVLKSLSDGMNMVARPQDPVCEILTEVYKEYDAKFRSAFGMRSHKD